MSAALSLFNPVRASFIVLAIMVAVVAGPFATLNRLGLVERIAYWAVTIVVSVFVAQFIVAIVKHLFPAIAGWKAVVIQSLGMGVLFSPLIWGWTQVMVPQRDIANMPFFTVMTDVVLISVAVFSAERLMRLRSSFATFEQSEAGSMPALQDDGLTPHAEQVPPPPRLIRRIDEADPGPILRLEALDHFVTAVTPLSHYHLRMRFADAVEEMDTVAGVMTHRSHWVALAAVTGAERHKGRLFLTVACGTNVPVSRKHMPAVSAQLPQVTASPRHRDANGAGSGHDSDSIRLQKIS